MSCKYWCEYEWCSIKDMNCYGGESYTCDEYEEEGYDEQER
jgi:hypothetical protein